MAEAISAAGGYGGSISIIIGVWWHSGAMSAI